MSHFIKSRVSFLQLYHRRALTTLFFLIQVISACCAQTVDHFYGEVSLSSAHILDTSPSNTVGTLKNNLGGLTLGYVLYPNIALETSITQGLGGRTVSIPQKNATSNFTFNTSLGLDARFFVKTTQSSELFTRVGPTFNSFSGSSTTNGLTDSYPSNSTSFLLSLGAATKISKNKSVFAEVTKLYGISDSQISIFTVGLRNNF
jgi:hypothetical protein